MSRMYPTEEKAYQWLLSQGYPEDGIIYSRKLTPDFITGDRGFEVKKVRNNTITLSETQLRVLKKINSTILATSEDSDSPILSIKPDLVKNKITIEGIKIYVIKPTKIVRDKLVKARKLILLCPRCQLMWKYKGRSKYYVTCSNCRYAIKIKEPLPAQRELKRLLK